LTPNLNPNDAVAKKPSFGYSFSFGNLLYLYDATASFLSGLI